MDNHVVYDYTVVDEIRATEAELQQAINQARRSIKLLTASVILLRDLRISQEMVDDE
jgi:hypothetical protein